MDNIKIFAPATVANVSCGFDSMGFAIENLGDTMYFEKTETLGVEITEITGAENLPLAATENAAGVVALAMLKAAKATFGIRMSIDKGFTPGSGLGSSAASSAGAAYGVNQLLEAPFSILELTEFARLGEQAACGSPIADNVAAALYGGFVLIRSYSPLDIVRLPVPESLRLVAIHPQIEVKTKDARAVLPETVPLKDAVTQWANVGGLVSGLFMNDYSLIQKSLVDIIVEPARKHLIPHFEDVKTAALEAGALGAGISGAGPTIFALVEGEQKAEAVREAIDSSYANKAIAYKIYSSKINTRGVQIIDE
ncbi:Homoserine kinase [Tenacibaculum litopenaei]|jgi:homoserine kinase|uniref:homoserine kinase n=1 Tax=Tenacibaculum litopenaei TaxID=396016 RepID=UPI0038959360